MTLDEVVSHTAALAEGTEVPVSVDLENGHGDEPEAAAEAITKAAEAGAVGGSIEDFDRVEKVYGIEQATERVSAAAEAAEALDFPFTLTGRAENYLRGNPDIDDTIARLQAYEKAGANVLYAPALGELEDVKAICDAVSAPVNVLARTGWTMAEVADAGAQRVSVGSRLTWVALAAMVSAAEEMRDEGSFAGLEARVDLGAWL